MKIQDLLQQARGVVDYKVWVRPRPLLEAIDVIAQHVGHDDHGAVQGASPLQGDQVVVPALARNGGKEFNTDLLTGKWNATQKQVEKLKDEKRAA